MPPAETIQPRSAFGSVKIRIDQNGFKSTEQNVSYDASRPGAVNTVLSVGTVAETVEVEAATTRKSQN